MSNHATFLIKMRGLYMSFQDILSEYPVLNIDLFATRINHKFDTNCSWKPDPGGTFVDAF